METRSHYIDNLRSALVLWVVWHHASIPYLSPEIFENALSDVRYHLFFGGMVRFTDVVLMPIFFLISGYFTASTFKYEGGLMPYTKKKLIYLGLPFAYGIFFFTGANRYFYDTVAIGYTGNYTQYLIDVYIKGQMVADHLWFLSLLLVFSLMAGGILACLKPKQKLNTGAFPIKSLLFLFLSTMGSLILMHSFVPDDHWVQMGQKGIFMFQTTRVGIYSCFFFFGLVCDVRGWRFHNLCRDVSLKKVGTAALIIAGAIEMFSLFFYNHDRLAGSFSLRVINGFLHTATLMAWTLVLLNLFYKYINFKTEISEKFSQSSYAIYLIHMPVVTLFHVHMRTMDLPVFIKFAIVFSGAVFLSYFIGYYFLRHLISPGKLIDKVLVNFGSRAA